MTSPSSNAEAQDLILPGLKLHHDMECQIPDWTAWEQVASRLRLAGAEFVSLRVTKRDDLVVARCRVCDISTLLIRGLVRELDVALAGRLLSLEHLYLPQAGAKA